MSPVENLKPEVSIKPQLKKNKSITEDVIRYQNGKENNGNIISDGNVPEEPSSEAQNGRLRPGISQTMELFSRGTIFDTIILNFDHGNIGRDDRQLYSFITGMGKSHLSPRGISDKKTSTFHYEVHRSGSGQTQERENIDIKSPLVLLLKMVKFASFQMD